MILIDTNIISEIRKIKTGRANCNVSLWAEQLDFTQTYLSAVVVGELYLGILLKRHNRDVVQANILQRWFDDLMIMYQGRILNVDSHVSKVFAQLQVPNPKAINDSYIAATAIAHDLTIATRNTQDFDGMPVKLINPFEWVSP